LSRWPFSLAAEQRADAAREKMPRIIDQLISLLEIHEANRIIVYSDRLVSRVDGTPAATGFNVLQWSSFAYELVRLCALWDAPADNRDSIPTIAALVEGADVRALLRQRIKDEWTTWPERGELQAARLIGRLDRALEIIAALQKSERLRNLVNHRDKNIAHSLSKSRAEMNGVAFNAPKYGYERKLLRVSISLADRLYLAINNRGFEFRRSRGQARVHAEGFWGAMRFEPVPKRSLVRHALHPEQPK
jgi:hypothetical protein